MKRFTFPYVKSSVSSISVFGLCIFMLISCQDWQKDVTVNGIHFAKLQRDTSDTIIGYTGQSVTIDGFVCEKGWIHFDKNMKLKFCALKESVQYKDNNIPAETWIRLDQDQDIVVCAFPRDTMIQNRLCKGTGGAKGFQTSFYKDGKLKSFFSSEEIVIDRIPCKAGGLTPIVLHTNGKLKECTVAKECKINNQTISANTAIHLDENGTLISVH